MTLARYYIVNMTLVNIESYTDGLNTPGRATIFGVDDSISIFSPATMVNLITSNILLLQQQISKPGVTSYERTLLSGFDSQIYLLRTSLRMNNVDVKRDTVKDRMREGNFIKCIYLQHKSVTLTNMSFMTTGYLLFTLDPMSFHAENVYIDHYALMGGFVMRTDCNYPEAYVRGTAFMNNVT